MAEDFAMRIDKRLMRRAFERAAKTYDQAAMLQREVSQRLLERLDLVVGAGIDSRCRQRHGCRESRLSFALSRVTRRRARYRACDVASGAPKRSLVEAQAAFCVGKFAALCRWRFGVPAAPDFQRASAVLQSRAAVVQ